MKRYVVVLTDLQDGYIVPIFSDQIIAYPPIVSDGTEYGCSVILKGQISFPVKESAQKISTMLGQCEVKVITPEGELNG